SPRALLRRASSEEDGFGIVEIIMAMSVISIAVLALVAVFAASAVSFQLSAKRGTATTLAEAQMEIYRTVSFTGIRINGTLIPTPTRNPYVRGHPAEATTPPPPGRAPAGQTGDAACPSTPPPAACLPVQTLTGADGRSYTVDSYVDYVNNDSTFSVR